MRKKMRIYAVPPEFDEDPYRRDRIADLAAELAAALEPPSVEVGESAD